MSKATNRLTNQSIEDFIVVVRKNKVILDYEVAMLYGVATRDVKKP